MAFQKKQPGADVDTPETDPAEEQGASPPAQGSGGFGGGDDEEAEASQGASEAPADESTEEGAAQQGGVQASPEQQAQYAKFVNQGYHLIYNGGKVNPAILKSLASGEPMRALATTAVEVVMRLLTSAKQQGITIDPAVELHGGKALYEELADLSAKAGIHKFEQKELDTGFVLAMAMAQKKLEAAGMLDKGAFQREVQEINQAQQDGQLDHQFPALGDVVKKIGPDIEKHMQAQNDNAAPTPTNDQQPMPAGRSGGLM